jgi:hypothetical protein
MKKQLLKKVFTALFLLAVSVCFINLQGQVTVMFPNDSADVGNSTTGGMQPLILNFQVADDGDISLNASSKNLNEDVQRVVNSWDSDSVGTTDNAELIGKKFSLVITTNTDRVQSRLSGGGGLGTRGKNQWRIDDAGAESMYFVLYGNVGVEFTQFAYNDFNDEADNGNFRFMDYDSDKTYYLDTPVLTGDTVYTLPAGEMSMRYETDTLTVSTSDTITGSSGNEGGRLYGLSFNVLEAEPMPPLPTNQFALEFPNPTDTAYGNPNGLQPMAFEYAIDGTGKISVDASTESDFAPNIRLVDTWDSDDVGTTDISSLFNTSFTLHVTTNKRIQNDKGGGLGVQGRNQWRIDDAGTEYLYFVLEGDVGLGLEQFKFVSLNDLGEDDLGHLRWMDYDTKENYFIENWSGDVGFHNVPEDEILIRFRGDSMSVTTSDTIDGNAGAKLFGMVFDLREPLPKTPAVLNTNPAHADTLVQVTTDYVIWFDNPMNQSVSSGAISITPAVSNRVDTWDAESKQLTMAFDDLSFYTEYTVTVGAGVEGTNGLNALGDTTFTFQTLPDAPTLLSTYPADGAVDIPVGSPMTMEFSRSMNRDSVEHSLSFEPALSDLSFSWNGSSTKAVVSTAQMTTNTQYTGTLSTNTTDAYGVTFAAPATFSFTTAAGVGVENSALQGVVLYPNPASGVLYIEGMDVSAVNIHSITGLLMKTKLNSKEIDLSDIEPGSYVVTVADNEENSVRKLIVIQ